MVTADERPQPFEGKWWVSLHNSFSYACGKVSQPPFSGVKRMVFLPLLGVEKMMVWKSRMKGILH